MNIVDLLKDSNKAREVLKYALVNKNKELAEALIPIVKDSYLTHLYARKIVGGKIKNEWEDIIAHDPWSSCYYARDILHGPWPKGEDAIAQNSEYSYIYAKDVLHKPFIRGEDVIARDPYYSYYYAKDVSKGRFVKGENVIIKSIWLDDYVWFLKRKHKLNKFLKDHPEVKL